MQRCTRPCIRPYVMTPGLRPLERAMSSAQKPVRSETQLDERDLIYTFVHSGRLQVTSTVRLERLTLPGLCALACRVAREPWLLVR